MYREGCSEQPAGRRRAAGGDTHTEVVTSMCGVCPAGCGAHVRLVDGRIDSLKPIDGHPRRLLCARGVRAKQIVYSPDRLLHPTIRRDGSGSGGRSRASWNEAYEVVVSGLRRVADRHGPEAVCMYTGRGNFEVGLNGAFAPEATVESSANAVLFPFGSPNSAGVGSLCYVAFAMIATRACFGEYQCDMDPDLERASRVVVWGANPATATPRDLLGRIQRARRRGADVVVIDHRRSETARAVDAEWIGVRPGTDGALALGVIHVMIRDRLYDRAFVENWTHGFRELSEYASAFDPQRVAEITGVAAERVSELARQLTGGGPCALVMNTGLEYSDSGVQAIRAVWSLFALAGHLDAVGGNRFRVRPRPRPHRTLTPVPAHARPPIGAGEYPLYRAVRNEAHAALLPRAILHGDPYPVRALIISGASLITSWPNPRLWRRALSALDLLVVVDRFPTADAAYADVVLPAATLFETESFMIYDTGWAQLRQRVIPPQGEARSDYLIFAELARRLGYGHRWPQSELGMIELGLQGTGASLEELRANPAGFQLPVAEAPGRGYELGRLRADGKPGFATPTGKFELSSEWLRAHGYEPLPIYTEPAEGPRAAPEVAARYPLVLNTGARTPHSFRSQDRNIPALVEREPEPLVWIHPRDAAARGIADGDPVEVQSPRGAVSFWARVTSDVVAGVVEAAMGGGGPLGPEAWQRCNVNELTDLDHRDPVSGFPIYKALLCEVVKRRSPPPGHLLA